MNTELRLLLIIGALLTTYYFSSRVNRGKIKTEDSLFWIIFSVFLVIIAIAPILITKTAELLGFQSPANFLFLIIIFILIIKDFYSTIKISKLEIKVTSIVQYLALKEHKEEKAKSAEDKSIQSEEKF